MPKSKEPKTHFEQVRLEIVKQIVDEEISSDKANGVEQAVGPPARKRAVFAALGSATVKALSHPSHGRHDGALNVDKRQERLMELGEPAANAQAFEELVKLSDEKLL